MGREHSGRVSWSRWLVALALLAVAGLLLLVLVPLDAPTTVGWGLPSIPAVFAAFILAGAASMPDRGYLVGALAYLIVGFVVSILVFFEDGIAGMVSEPLASLFSILFWPHGLALHFYGN